MPGASETNIACSHWIHLHSQVQSCSDAELLSYLPSELFCPLALQGVWTVSCGSWPTKISPNNLQDQAAPATSSGVRSFCWKR